MTWLTEEINYRCKVLQDIPNVTIGRMLKAKLAKSGIEIADTTIKNWLVGRTPPMQTIEGAVKIALKSVRQDIQTQMSTSKSPLSKSLEGVLR